LSRLFQVLSNYSSGRQVNLATFSERRNAMNSPNCIDNQAANGAQVTMVSLAAGQGDATGESQFMIAMPNGDPDHVMLWGDDEDGR